MTSFSGCEMPLRGSLIMTMVMMMVMMVMMMVVMIRAVTSKILKMKSFCHLVAQFQYEFKLCI